MKRFVRFPHTAHLAWLGAECPRDDKVLSSAEASAFLAGKVVVEEKLDGANLGISVGRAGGIQMQNRGEYLTAPFSGQFTRVASWLAAREDILAEALSDNLILFGEWCTARHSLDYAELPDWFLAFDIYDREECRFWNTARRDDLLGRLGLCAVPTLFAGRTTMNSLKELVIQERSRFRRGELEGIIIRRENEEWLESRAKLVHPAFTQAISQHWSRRTLEWNRLISERPHMFQPET